MGKLEGWSCRKQGQSLYWNMGQDLQHACLEAETSNGDWLETDDYYYHDWDTNPCVAVATTACESNDEHVTAGGSLQADPKGDHGPALLRLRSVPVTRVERSDATRRAKAA